MGIVFPFLLIQEVDVNLNYAILIGSILFMSTALLLFVPRDRLLPAHISFLFMQAVTWIIGALVVEFDLIVYPVRLLQKAYEISLVYEYFFQPALSVFFNIYFPVEATYSKKIFYVLAYPTVITIFEAILERYTDVIEYVNWNPFYTFATVLVTLWLSYIYYRWFLGRCQRGELYHD